LKVSKLGPSFENFKTVPVLRQAGTVLKTKKTTVRLNLTVVKITITNAKKLAF
jgi:hypothetical protein